MYKFKRSIYLEDRTVELWFGLTSKSRDRHSNFTLYLLTEGPDNPFSYAEPIKSGISTKSEADRLAITYAKDLLRQLIDREKEQRKAKPAEDPDTETSTDTTKDA